MIPVVTAAEMRALDRATIDEIGLPAVTLMETAGRAVAEAALRVLAIMAREGRPLSELATVMTRTPQVLINTVVDKKVPLDQLPDVLRMIADIERELGDDGRVLVRYSGTETKARVMIEGIDEGRIRSWAEEIAGALARSCRTVAAAT